MLARVCLVLTLFSAIPLWSQVEPSATGPPPDGDTAMQTPPAVNGEAYPTETGSESRLNELKVGLNFQTAYDDNVLGLGTTTPVADTTFSVGSTVALDKMTPRLHQAFTYNSGFTLYQHTSSRNETDQSVSADLLYRISPHVSASFRDSFQKSTNIFNQPDGSISGSAPSLPAVEAPFADQIGNGATGEVSYQFSSNGMIGGSGTSRLLDYPKPSQAAGLSNSNSIEGSAFYNLRVSSSQYVGMNYQYSNMKSSALNSESVTRMNTIYIFYSVYLKHELTFSVSGGPQYFNLAEFPFPASASWTPAITASMGWQRNHTNLVANYSRTITGAGGLVGTFESNSASASARWQFSRTWTVGSTGSYSIEKNVLPALFSSNAGGHTYSGAFSVQHPLTERFTSEIGYTRLHQSYGGIAAISSNPDSDRVFISISYQLTRPLGR